MPRAFLITNKRYNSTVDYEEHRRSRDASPESQVSTAEGPSSICTYVPEGEDADSIGYDDLKPASPHSPAHETRSPQNSNMSPRIHGLTDLDPTSFSNASFNVQTTPLVSVIRQLMRHHPPPDATAFHACEECGKRYSTSSNLARHRQTHRSVSDQKARHCPHCGKVYVSMPAFSMHVRTHSQGCRCPYCGKCFSRPWLLQGHIRTHTGEKPFTCPVCRKAFADKSNLRAHIQTHSTSKPHVCGRCGKAFALKSYLYKHEESSCMRVHKTLDLAVVRDSDRKDSLRYM